MPHHDKVRVDPASEVNGPPPDGRKASHSQSESTKTPPAKPARKRVNAPRQQKPPAIAVTTAKAPPISAFIVVAGMRHSGSTALFNILRLGFARAGARVVSGYSEHKQTEEILPQKDALRLVKTHEFRDDIAAAADLIFTARRDLRDSVASAVRRDFIVYRQLRTPVEYAKHNRALHAMWAPHSDFEFVYETFMADPVAVTADVLEAAGLSSLPAAAICRAVLKLPTDDNATTLLTPQHITDPTHQLTFRDTLAPHDVKTIEAHHYKWLRRHRYAINP